MLGIAPFFRVEVFKDPECETAEGMRVLGRGRGW